MKKNGIRCFLFSVVIRTHTWARDSHGLFDYDSSKLTKAQIKTASQSYIIRKDQEVLQIFHPLEKSEEIRYLAQLQVIEGNIN